MHRPSPAATTLALCGAVALLASGCSTYFDKTSAPRGTLTKITFDDRLPAAIVELFDTCYAPFYEGSADSYTCSAAELSSYEAQVLLTFLSGRVEDMGHQTDSYSGPYNLLSPLGLAPYFGDGSALGGTYGSTITVGSNPLCQASFKQELYLENPRFDSITAAWDDSSYGRLIVTLSSSGTQTVGRARVSDLDIDCLGGTSSNLYTELEGEHDFEITDLSVELWITFYVSGHDVVVNYSPSVSFSWVSANIPWSSLYVQSSSLGTVYIAPTGRPAAVESNWEGAADWWLYFDWLSRLEELPAVIEELYHSQVVTSGDQTCDTWGDGANMYVRSRPTTVTCATADDY
ncbi:MAG: hypothetical protein HYV63_13985 [Candidatus Schekmanbacteria bacterium]|nr:hypothetical protein [Candidatus Schekmanbacteria bacterium]